MADRYGRHLVSYAPTNARVAVSDNTRPFGGQTIAWAYTSEADHIVESLNERDILRAENERLRRLIGEAYMQRSPDPATALRKLFREANRTPASPSQQETTP
jgi:hypothetical protein